MDIKYVRSIGFLIAVAIGASAASSAAAPGLEQISVNTNESPGNDYSGGASITRDGNKVVFATRSDNMTPTDYGQVVLRNRKLGTTKVVSRNSRGNPANLGGFAATISPNGRFVAFTSTATNLAKPDKYVEPRWDCYDYHCDPYWDVFVRDLRTGRTRRASSDLNGNMANHSSWGPTVANNGDVAFNSLATDLVPKDTNENQDVFVYDWNSREVSRVSVRTSGRQSGTWSYVRGISADGSIVAIYGDASALARAPSGHYKAVLHFRGTHRSEWIPFPRGIDDGTCGFGRAINAISANARMSVVNCIPMHEQSDGSLELEPQRLYRFDRLLNRFRRTTPLPTGDYHVYSHDISPGGRYVTWCTEDSYGTESTEEEADDDAFIKDLKTGEWARLDDFDPEGSGWPCDTRVSEGASVMLIETPRAGHAGDVNEAGDIYAKLNPL